MHCARSVPAFQMNLLSPFITYLHTFSCDGERLARFIALVHLRSQRLSDIPSLVTVNGLPGSLHWFPLDHNG